MSKDRYQSDTAVGSDYASGEGVSMGNGWEGEEPGKKRKAA